MHTVEGPNTIQYIYKYGGAGVVGGSAENLALVAPMEMGDQDQVLREMSPEVPDSDLINEAGDSFVLKCEYIDEGISLDLIPRASSLA